uniref:Uncharacterized protein n=1 Tax=Lactuca sativa TaxID=4236 RepID=A0A9R1X4F9_LACSA|nr:hypothetical protein LSAT_V11C600331570 [Lactuca sativa]
MMLLAAETSSVNWNFARKWPSFPQGPQLGILCGFLSLCVWLVVISPVVVLITWGCCLILILGRDIISLVVIMAGTALLLAFYSIMLWRQTQHYLMPFSLRCLVGKLLLVKLYPRRCSILASFIVVSMKDESYSKVQKDDMILDSLVLPPINGRNMTCFSYKEVQFMLCSLLSDPSDSSEPPEDQTYGELPDEFNTTWIHRGGPILNVSDLSIEARHDYGHIMEHFTAVVGFPLGDPSMKWPTCIM